MGEYIKINSSKLPHTTWINENKITTVNNANEKQILTTFQKGKRNKQQQEDNNIKNAEQLRRYLDNESTIRDLLEQRNSLSELNIPNSEDIKNINTELKKSWYLEILLKLKEHIKNTGKHKEQIGKESVIYRSFIQNIIIEQKDWEWYIEEKTRLSIKKAIEDNIELNGTHRTSLIQVIRKELEKLGYERDAS